MTTNPVEESPVDLNVTRVLEILLAFRQVSLKELIIATGIGKSTMIRRRAAGGWSAAEVANLATALDVPVAVFYADPQTLLAFDNKSRFFRDPASGVPEPAADPLAA